ncbi:MAG: TonB-dependent receptor [Fluviicola sp.]|nr:TonB-dependent receptor [Fluviicola sp.]
MRTLFVFLLGILPFALFAQNTQTIKGTVLDKQSLQPLPGVQIEIVGSEPKKGSVTDLDGKFRITDLAPGRYDVRISFPGYIEQTRNNVVLTSGKEEVLEIQLEESVTDIGEVVINANKNNDMNNELTTVSGRSFSMEEVNRYAGGRSDPARLASNFAGVSSPDDSRNDIVIRGNSPIGVLWRIEGMNIPNPNHFSTIGTTGGPVSAINTNLLRNSDFMTSAFPSEYGNANAGVFDLGLRNGNSDKREHTIQFGVLTGLEFNTEGPINKEKGSSYLIGYRYGFSSVAQTIGLPIGTAATPYYQDLSFKVNTGTTKIGKFTFFGIGALSSIDFLHKEIDTNDLFADPTRDSYFTSQIGLFGIKHNIRVNDKSYFNTVIGVNYAGSNYLQDSINASDEAVRTIENKTGRLNYSLNTSYNSKISARLFIKAGIIAELMNIDLYYRNREDQPFWVQLWDTKEQTVLLQGYVHSKYSFSDKLTMNLGVHSQYLALNNSLSVEPRFGLKYQVGKKSSLNLGYGMHSQMQALDSYFLQSLDANGNAQLLNKNMDFTRSHHLVLAYDWTPLKDWRFKSEIYYQYLNNVPVDRFSSSYSMLNAGASFYPNNRTDLVNDGTGQNYGVELTIEKFFSKGFYGLITGSLYEAKYTGSDGIERNTAFNGRYVYNVLIGKEVKVGKAKRNALTLDVKFTHAGGRFYTPVDLVSSQLFQQQILKGDEYAFTEKYADFMRLDVKVGFTLNAKKRKISQSWFFDVNNVTNRKNIFAERYNPVTNSINTAYQIGFFPNFVYRLQF